MSKRHTAQPVNIRCHKCGCVLKTVDHEYAQTMRKDLSWRRKYGVTKGMTERGGGGRFGPYYCKECNPKRSTSDQ